MKIIYKERKKMTKKVIEYPCGCFYIVEVLDNDVWKVIDFCICDEHLDKFIKIKEE